jgi:hypothetical protein
VPASGHAPGHRNPALLRRARPRPTARSKRALSGYRPGDDVEVVLVRLITRGGYKLLIVELISPWCDKRSRAVVVLEPRAESRRG